jgi:hypothetical protein
VPVTLFSWVGRSKISYLPTDRLTFFLMNRVSLMIMENICIKKRISGMISVNLHSVFWLGKYKNEVEI